MIFFVMCCILWLIIVFKMTKINDKQKIPKNIFQTFKTKSLPPGMKKAQNSWKSLNPEYNYYFYDDNDISKYVSQFNCNGFSFSNNELQKAFNKIKPGAGKADMFRYLIIYDNGGVYMDIDTTCKTPLRYWINSEDEMISGIGGRGDLHQWGLVYKKHHPFMKRAIENAVDNILQENFVKG